MGGLIYWIVVGLIAGWLAGKVMKGGGIWCGGGHHPGDARRDCWRICARADRTSRGRIDRGDRSGICGRGDSCVDYAEAEEGVAKFLEMKKTRCCGRGSGRGNVLFVCTQV